jgi:hypothetical protein
MAMTKDWGPQFARVADLFAAKGRAYAHHEHFAGSEVAAHDGSHSYGRHGYQTGWESQFVRAVTSVTPDQVFDPRGVGAAIRRWHPSGGSMAGIGVGMGAHGETGEITLFDDPTFDPQATDYEKKPGSIAGGFLSPEAQMRSRNKALSLIGSLATPMHAGAVWRFQKPLSGGHRVATFSAPLTSVRVVVSSARDGEPLGIGFAQRDPKTYRKESREMVMACIEGFQLRRKWTEIFKSIDVSVRKFPMVALNKNKVAFPQITDLFEYFDVDVLWQTSATVIFRRTYTPPGSFSAWRMITMFPDDAAPGWAPSLFLSPAWKTRLKNSGMNANAADYAWTGRTSNVARSGFLTFPVPSWA